MLRQALSRNVIVGTLAEVSAACKPSRIVTALVLALFTWFSAQPPSQLLQQNVSSSAPGTQRSSSVPLAEDLASSQVYEVQADRAHERVHPRRSQFLSRLRASRRCTSGAADVAAVRATGQRLRWPVALAGPPPYLQHLRQLL